MDFKATVGASLGVLIFTQALIALLTIFLRNQMCAACFQQLVVTS